MHKANLNISAITESGSVGFNGAAISLTNRGTSVCEINNVINLQPGESFAFPAISELVEYNTELSVSFQSQSGLLDKLIVISTKVIISQGTLDAQSGKVDINEVSKDVC
tara:strand:- start:3026 stop:3352 length:327 start_codon:yes stop_codon:yes gene_type:complete